MVRHPLRSSRLSCAWHTCLVTRFWIVRHILFKVNWYVHRWCQVRLLLFFPSKISWLLHCLFSLQCSKHNPYLLMKNSSYTTYSLFKIVLKKNCCCAKLTNCVAKGVLESHVYIYYKRTPLLRGWGVGKFQKCRSIL